MVVEVASEVFVPLPMLTLVSTRFRRRPFRGWNLAQSQVMATRSAEVVITGLGIVSPIGIGANEFWASALAGTSGIGHISRFDVTKLPAPCRVVGEVRNFR